MPKATKKDSESTADKGEPFALGSVDKTKPPMEGEKGTWHRYTITQGANVITGYRKGSRTAVTRAVKDIVAELNERRFGRRGRVHLTSPSR
jgi:hypothetical protein